jgi:hypothetical protein
MGLENALGELALNETLVACNTKLDLILAELGQKLESGQQVALDAATLAALESISATVSNFPNDYPSSAVLAKLEAIRVLLAAPLAVSGTVTANTGLSQPLTDAQLRAAAVPVSIASMPTTPVTGTFWQSVQPISGTVTANTGLSQPLTDAQLRASELPVSASALPLPTGAATETAVQDVTTTLQSVIRDEDTAHSSGQKGVPILAIRSDSDTPTADDGDYTLLKLDEQGRLKVATKPASIAPTTGAITAIQATIGTPVAGGTVIADVSRASNVVMFCTGTFSTINVSFEASIEAAGENWFSIQAVRSNANTIETATGNLSAAPAYSWEMSVNGYQRVRVRCTARTSGTQNWIIQPGSYATEPIPAAQVTGTQAVSGTVTANQGTLVAGGTTNTIINSAASTNGTVVKGSAGTVYSVAVSNINAAIRYLKLYNSTTVTVGTTTPAITIPIPAGGIVNLNLGAIGQRFATGICIGMTTGAADNDTGAVAAGEIKALISYI